jgi:acyl-CoA thioester hydrolase
MTHKFHLRVYYEDTDMAGIVYYANYLKFIERARSTLVREADIDQNEMKDQNGLVFTVRRVQADYFAPAKMNDELWVETSVQQVSGARIVFCQEVYRDNLMLFSAVITVACATLDGKAARVPAEIRAKLDVACR